MARQPDHLHFDLRVSCRKLAQYRGQQRGRVVVGYTDDDTPLDLGMNERRPRFVPQGEHAPSVIGKHEAFLCRYDMARAPLEDRLAERLFERLDLHAHG